MENSLERLSDSVTGYGLWRKPTPVGGYEYWTDDNAIGRKAWDDALDDPTLIFDILDREGTLEQWLDYYKDLKASEK
jgi:hypothetical protein